MASSPKDPLPPPSGLPSEELALLRDLLVASHETNRLLREILKRCPIAAQRGAVPKQQHAISGRGGMVVER